MRAPIVAAAVMWSLALTASHQPSKVRISEPILVDLDGDGFALTGPADGVTVDIDGDGVRERVGWTSAGDDDAFLCADYNKNGIIDVPSELIGGTSGPPVGFALLASMDGVAQDTAKGVRERRPDGYLDKADAFFAELILWTDTNHNGRSEEDELQSLPYAGIDRIVTGYEGIPSIDAAGNHFKYRSTARRAGARGVPVMREMATVRFSPYK